LIPMAILIIEDHTDNLELMSYLLKAFGYATLAAADGLTGLELARSRQPELIVCDIQLPGIDGFEIARRLKEDDGLRKIPLVAITALAMVGDRERVLAAGFDGYIAKPIVAETFVSDMENFLRVEHRMRRTTPAANTSAPAVSASGGGAEAVTVPRGTILVVDNLPANLDLARSIFEPSGYRVLLAEEVAAAVALAKESPPDLVLSDVNLPEGSGLELVVHLKSDPKLEAVPVVLISATLPRDTKEELVLAAGATKFLRRPIDPDLLLEEVETCLEAARRGAGAS